MKKSIMPESEIYSITHVPYYHKHHIFEGRNRQNSENILIVTDKDAKYGFYKYDTAFSFYHNGSEKIYTGVVLIRNDANGKKYLYDILNIRPQKKSVDLPSVASNSKTSSARFDGSSNQSVDNLPQKSNNVNSDTSSTDKYY